MEWMLPVHILGNRSKFKVTVTVNIISPFPTMFPTISENLRLLIPLQNKCFQGYTGITLSVCVSICVQNTSFFQSAGRGI